MHFFTDITTNLSNLCLLHIDHYFDKRKEKKEMIFVDPGVYRLKGDIEYPEFELLHELAAGKLQPNEYLSIDYPSDMNFEFEDFFVQETIRNNLRYADNPQYLCTLQYKFGDYASFMANFNHLKPIFWKKDKIVGLGNLCRIMYPNDYTDQIFAFLRANMEGIKQLHFYGLGLRIIREYFPLFSREQLQKISVDSTKWTKAVRKEVKYRFGVCAKKNTRNYFFYCYIDEINLILRWKDFVKC